jgi:hypothetical protein
LDFQTSAQNLQPGKSIHSDVRQKPYCASTHCLQITILEHPSNEVIKLLEATITDGQTSNYNVVEMKDLEMSRDAAQIIFKLWERNVLASAAWHWESSIVGSKKHHNKRWLLFRILQSTTILLNSDIEKPKPIKGSQQIN